MVIIMVSEKIRKNIECFIDMKKEFVYLKSISKVCQYDFNSAVNYCLDSYNTFRKQGVEDREARFLALYHTNRYAGRLLVEKNKLMECD